ncbi:MAG: PQQ-dependent sugar dehydrogenase, partial [Trueperaceae bacterium]
MLIPTKGGQLWVYENGAVLPTPAIDLSGVMCTNGERAMGDVAVHPNFEANHYIYIYYTFNKFGTCNESEIDGPVNRLSRFVLPHENIIDPATEVVLFDTSPLFRDHHNSGDVEFGSDGNLYVTVGDGGGRRFDWPQDPGILLGKIIRLTDTGDIPLGNPFTGVDSARCHVDGVPPAGSPAGTKCQEVFSLGLRNPFRFAFDSNSESVRFFINDVGQHTWEEISEGPVVGGNYGWPAREGPCALDSTTDCELLPGFDDPIHWYQHGVNGAAVTGGAFVPNGLWPASYDGSYLFADYVFGTIYQLLPGEPGCRSCSPPTSNSTTPDFAVAPRVVSMIFGPPNDPVGLYYVSREDSEVRLITYAGGANRAPTAVATADPAFGMPPLDVQFDGTSSTDPDLDPLSYEWDFESDGVSDSTEPAPLHRYDTLGTVFATLTVRDGRGGEDTTSLRVDVGNTPPTPSIEAPLDGTTFAVGEIFTLRGSATDVEDGGALADTSLTWEVRQHHADHWHPFLDPTPGNNLELAPAPEPEDFLAATNSFLEILLTATDSSGLSTTVSRTVMPRTVDLIFESDPPGLNLALDGFTVMTPTTEVSWENHNLQLDAPDQTDAGGISWRWESWSDGGAQQHTISVPATPVTYSATFQQVQVDSLTFNPTDDATIRESRPDRNYGLEANVEVDLNSRKDALWRFEVSGTGGSVASAVLRLYATDGSSYGGDFFKTTDTFWSEATVTWSTAPAGDGGLLGSLGQVDAGNWYEVDVSSLVTGDGVVSIRASSSSNNGVDYASKEEGSFVPELVVTLGEPPAPDETAPSAPGNFRAVEVGASEVLLEWDASTDNVGVTGYGLYRDGELLVELGAVTLFRDVTVDPLTSYRYEVNA